MKQLVVTKEGSIIDARHDRPEKIAITRANAETVRNFEHTTLKNADGSPARARRTGKTKLWKREPERFQIPVKYGLKVCFYITNDNAHEWYSI